MKTEVPEKTSRAAELFGVQMQPKNARDRLLLKAIDLFYYHGFNAVGLDRVIEETGVTKTTFYKHFESKDDLVVAAIEMRDEWENNAWETAVKKLAGDDPRAQLVGLYDVLDIWFNDPIYNGCVFMNAAGEFPNPNDPVHRAAVVHKKKFRNGVAEKAGRAKLNEPEVFADQYVTLFEGTLVMRHVHSRNDAAKRTKPLVEALVAQHA